ncbi:hypothetical protein [Polyangium spumosum]|uniref:NHLP leader peptide family natural product n=1 Tax=Polyangium spumosum TaxID=889282 RepID=A0A6N7PSB9_9BACT|nr:hypothetical protein [Polyangium spumosum]MRG93716.1 hypothetical protein [Polyangium spumosum]
MEKTDNLNKVQWGFLVAHAWSEGSFRKQLEDDPSGTIKSFAKQHFGLEIAHDVALPMDLPMPPADLGVEALTLGTGQHAAPGTASGTATAPGTASGTATAPGTASGTATAPGTASGTATAGGEVHKDTKSN